MNDPDPAIVKELRARLARLDGEHTELLNAIALQAAQRAVKAGQKAGDWAQFLSPELRRFFKEKG